MLLQIVFQRSFLPFFAHIEAVDSKDAPTFPFLLAHNYHSNWITAFAPENMVTWINGT